MKNNKNDITPPRLAEKLLLRFLKSDLAEEVLGDLDEKYYLTANNHSLSKAKRNYWYQVIHYLRPFALKKSKVKYSNNTAMFKHNLLISYRSLLRFKNTFLINLTGLASGLACALLIYLWAVDELSMDKFHENNDQLYQVLQNTETAAGILTFEWTPSLLSESLIAQFPEVETGTTLLPTNYFDGFSYLVHENNHHEVKEQFIDSRFFDVFTFPMVIGQAESLTKQPEQVFISRQMAERLFSTPDQAMGETVRLENEAFDKDFIVSGVFEDVPKESSLQFNALFNIADYIEVEGPGFLRWNSNNPNTYVVLNDGTDLTDFNKRIYGFVEAQDPKAGAKLFAQKFDERYLNGLYKDGQVVGGRKAYVQLFLLVGMVVLIIACINFMNLSTAKANTRLKELGVKKALGALRSTLIGQYYTEALLITFLATVLAIGLALGFLPFFNQLTGKQLVIEFNAQMILSLLGIIGITTLLSGSYPALYLSRLKAISSLKGKLSGGFGDLWIRKGLVVFQFGITIILIVSVLVISNQISYIQSKNLGYNRDNVAYFANAGLPEGSHASFFNEIKRLPGVLQVTAASHDLTGDFGRTSGIAWPGRKEDERLSFLNLQVGLGFIETMGMEIVKGRSLEEGRPNEFNKIILNETAIEQMGLENPIGQTLKVWGREKEIIGIVKDFHVRSLYANIEPTLIHPVNKEFPQTFVKIQGANSMETMSELEAIFAQFSDDAPFEYGFVDDAYQNMYTGEKQVATLSKSFAIVAILISCLGLLGLTAFTAERRAKEVGIRKVLGAGIWRIVYLLSGDFTKMVVLALVIALPVSYLVASQWIQDFAFAIDLSPIYFLLAGLIALGMAWLTVGFQTLRAAKANPVDSLRSE